MKDGAGTTTTLTGGSARTGSTTLRAGTLAITSDAALGSAPLSADTNLIFEGGVLRLNANIATLDPNRGLLLKTTQGTVDTNGFSTVIPGSIIGSGGLTKNGAGTLTLTAGNTFGGGTTVNGGTVIAAGDASLGAAGTDVRLNGGVLSATGTIPRGIVLGVAGGGLGSGTAATYSGVVSGLGALSVDTPGTVTLTAQNTYPGGTQVGPSGALLVTGSSRSLGPGPVTVLSGGLLGLSTAANMAPGFLVALRPGAALAVLNTNIDPAAIIDPDPANTTGGILALGAPVYDRALNMAAIGNGRLFLSAFGAAAYTSSTLGANTDGIYRLGNGFTTLSEVRDATNTPVSFCLPLSTTALASGCDQENLLLTSVLQVVPNAAVTAQYGVSNNTSGYQWWVFNPNGGFSRRIFFSHSAPSSGSVSLPANLRSTYFQLSMMSSAPTIPQFTLLNVRVRTKVAGVFGNFGPACRIKIDPLALCGTTQLTTTPTPIVSCGAVGVSRTTGVLWSNAVAGSPNKYQFEFTNSITNVLLRKLASPTRDLNMSIWGASPLPTCNVPYNVRVRVSFDGGTNYCAFGPVCQVTFTCPPNDSREVVALGTNSGLLMMWPNPNRGDQVNVRIDELSVEVGTATIDLIDLFGKKVVSENVTVDGTTLNYVLDLSSTIADGLYVVNITAGDHTYTERLVIAK